MEIRIQLDMGTPYLLGQAFVEVRRLLRQYELPLAGGKGFRARRRDVKVMGCRVGTLVIDKRTRSIMPMPVPEGEKG